MRGTVALLLLCLLLLPLPLQADIYKWKDASGQVHFSDADTGHPKAEKVRVRVNSYTHVTYATLAQPAAAASAKAVVLYGTSWCGYCKKARQYFQANGIAYTDLDIEADAQAKAAFAALGGRGVPVILVGNRRMNGFSEEGFRQIYR